MKIAIDVSQLAYKNTGVANYLENLVSELVKVEKNEYILFYSSLRNSIPGSVLNFIKRDNVVLKKFKFPPSFLDLIWNRLHIFPIENLIGDVNILITSDWTEPPVSKARKATIIYDLIVCKYPNETAKRIVDVQKRKLSWVKKESDFVFCISESTKQDVKDILGVNSCKLHVIYPGLTL